MIPINQPATDFRWLLNLSPSQAQSGTTPLEKVICVGNSLVTWGTPYDPDTRGFNLQVYAIKDPASSDSFGWEVLYPTNIDGVGVVSGTGVGFATLVRLRLEVDDVELTVDPDCSYNLSFSEIRVYVATTGSFTLAATITGPYADSGGAGSFDKRLNLCDMTASALDSPAALPVTYPSCATSMAGQPYQEHSANASVNGGVEWWDGSAWTSFPILIDLSVAPPTIECCASAGLPTISGTIGNDVTINAQWTANIGVEPDGSYSGPCSGGHGSCNYDRWTVSQSYQLQSSEVGIVSKDAGILRTSRDGTASCDGVAGTPIHSETTEAYTYCKYGRSVSLFFGYSECAQSTGPVFCPPGETCGSGLNHYKCSYGASASMGWPEKPPCEAAGEWPWNHETPSGQFYRTDIQDGDVWVYSSDHHIPAFANQLQVTSFGDCIRPVIAEDFRRRLHLTFTRINGSNVPSAHWQWSDDDGRSFSTEGTLGFTNGKYAFVAVSPDGAVLFGAFVYDSGTSGPGKIYTRYWGPGVQWADVPAAAPISGITFADDTFSFAFASDGAGSLFLHATEDGDTETSVWTSWDEGDTWGSKRSGISDGHYPSIACDPSGGLFVAALVYNSGPGPGKAFYRYQGPGDTALSTASALKDDAGSDLVLSDTTFHGSPAFHGASALVVSAVLDGDPATTEWQSWDEAVSALKVT